MGLVKRVSIPSSAQEGSLSFDDIHSLAQRTDAIALTTSAAKTHRLIVFEIDPPTPDSANGSDCITAKIGASNAGNITSALSMPDCSYSGFATIIPSGILG